MRTISRISSIALFVFATAAYGQQTAPQSDSQQAPAETAQPQPRSPGGDVGSGAGDIGKGAASGTGAAAKGVGKGTEDLVTLHPLNAAGNVGKGAGIAGKDVGVGAAKGTGKIAKGTGRALKKVF